MGADGPGLRGIVELVGGAEVELGVVAVAAVGLGVVGLLFVYGILGLLGLSF